jgi:hypothetical protein
VIATIQLRKHINSLGVIFIRESQIAFSFVVSCNWALIQVKRNLALCAIAIHTPVQFAAAANNMDPRPTDVTNRKA